MKNFYLKLFVTFIFGITISSSAYLIRNNTDRHSGDSKVSLHASIADFSTSIEEVVSKTDYIVIGKVVKSESYLLAHIPFTNYTIKVDNVLKGENKDFKMPKEIDIRITGGKIDNVEYELENSKALAQGEKYLFLLKKTFNDNPNSNVFTAVGEYQGIFNVKVKDNSTLDVIKSFNNKNKLEDKAIGKSLSELLNSK